ncbi:hypothetical protein F4779DRAFT_504345 [Xylariaceae sp. FL0662B]|nr:hypothetical protein F4779DRAFT_504345 [Xylariaceae sp. FL0662B]
MCTSACISDVSLPDQSDRVTYSAAPVDLLAEFDHEGDLQNCPVLDAVAYSSCIATTPKNENENFDSTCEEHQPPGPLSFPNLSHHLGRHSARVQDPKARARQHVKANFIISHTPDLASGVIETVYKELSWANKHYAIELRKIGAESYLHIAAPAKKTAELVEAARDLAEELIYGQSTAVVGIFQEPPPKAYTSFHIVLDITPSSREARPRLEPRPEAQEDDITAPALHDSVDDYAAGLSGALYRALKKAVRLSLSLALKVDLGVVMLQTYQRGNDVYDYGAFHAMVKNPRASGRLQTGMGDEALARKVLDFVRRDDSSSPFQPTDNRAPSAAHVLPEYFLEADSPRAKFEIHLSVNGLKRGRPGGSLQSVKVSEKNAAFAELDILNLSVGKKLDWKFEGINQQKGPRKYPSMVRFMDSARVQVQGENPDETGDFDTYPRVLLSGQNATVEGFTSVVIKTVYRFGWKDTSYAVLVVINRRWSSIGAMMDSTRPRIDVNISVCGEDWDKEDQAAANTWGDELQHLFRDGRAGPHDGMARVANFLQTIRDIRDVFDPLF